MRFLLIIAALLVSGLAPVAQADLILNPPMPITHLLEVQVIQVAEDDGTNAAPLFGSPSEQSAIFGFVDQIWAQAGIDVEFTFRAGTYDDSFALTGTASPRPTDDLTTIVADADAAGATDPDRVDLFMVRVVPRFSQLSDNSAAGFAFVGSDGITMWAGPNLTSFEAGQEVIASVLAHEIGHNLGLGHLVEDENLMQEGGSSNPGERLNATQISTALSSDLLTPVPEPSSFALLALAAGGAWLYRKRRRELLAA